ncbi:MAG: peptide chain release factor N(5)-glutamine methyltransferase [Patescibacteria group bacterium]
MQKIDSKILAKKFSILISDVEIICSHFLGISKERFISKNFEIDKKSFLKLSKLLQKKSQKIPTAYILQKKEFFGKTFFVSHHTLIPRPETEKLIEIFLEKIEKLALNSDLHLSKNIKIFDIGTGSGNIAITLKKFLLNSCIFAIDKNKFALKIAKKNAKLHNAKINFFRSNLLKNKKLQKISPDFIIANLPYVPKKSYFSLEKNIYFEPKDAIVAGKSGLKFIKKLLDQIKKFGFDKNLKGIFLEIDPSQSEFLQKLGFEILNFYEESGRFAVKNFIEIA